MYPWVALLTCLACVSALPAMFLPYRDERGGTDGASLLDCTPSTDGSYRCRPTRHRNPNRAPGPDRLHVLEILEEDREGMTVLEIAEVFPLSPKKKRKQQNNNNNEVDPSFVITVLEQPDPSRPRCGPHQVYVPEVDICEDMADHRVPPKAPVVGGDDPPPFVITSVGRFDTETCPEGHMMVPEVGICMEINPPAPLEPHQRR